MDIPSALQYNANVHDEEKRAKQKLSSGYFIIWFIYPSNVASTKDSLTAHPPLRIALGRFFILQLGHVSTSLNGKNSFVGGLCAPY